MADKKVTITAEDRTARAFAAIDKNILGVESNLKKLTGAFAAMGGVAGIGYAIKRQIDLGDELSKTSQKVKLSVEQLSAYQYAAKLSGVSNEELTGTLAKLAKNIHEAGVDKTGEAARYFRALGIEVTDAGGKSRNTGQVFDELAAKLAAAGDSTDRTAIEMKLLGKTGNELAPLINNLHELTEEAKAVGAVVSTDFARKAEQFNDSMERMQLSLGNTARHIAVAVVPGFNALIEKINVVMGAQERLSMVVLERDREALTKEYERLREREKQLGYIEPFAMERKAQILVDIEGLDELIRVEKSRLQQLEAIKAAGGNAELPKASAFSAPDSKNQSAFQGLEAKLLSETDLELRNYQERLKILDTAESQKIATMVSYDTLREQLKEQHEKKILQIEDEAAKKKNKGQQVYRKLDLDSAGFFFGMVSNLMQSNNKKQFDIGKKAAIAQAAIHTYEMAVGAYRALSKIYIVGPVLGAAAAAAAIAFGRAQIQGIQSQQFGGGGAVGAAAPSFSANPNTGMPTGTPGGEVGQPFNRQAPQTVVNVHVVGTIVSSAQDWLENVAIPGIVNAVENKDVELIPKTSRNAMNLATVPA